MPDVPASASLDADAQIAVNFTTGRAWQSLAPDRRLACGTAVAAFLLAAGSVLGGGALIAALFASGLLTALLLLPVVTAEGRRAEDLTAQAAQMTLSTGALRRARQALVPRAAPRRVLIAAPGFLPLFGALGLTGVDGRVCALLIAAFGVTSVLEQWRRMNTQHLTLAAAALAEAAWQRDAAAGTARST